MSSILLVDDDRSMLRILQLIFERAKYQVYLAKGSAEALEIIYQHFPDVVLIDDMMPEMTGSQVCVKLKTDPLTCKIPVIIHSAGNDVLDEELMREIQADAALRKPSHPSELLRTVERCLAVRA
jgi:CheY-like chemotaxis protein